MQAHKFNDANETAATIFFYTASFINSNNCKVPNNLEELSIDKSNSVKKSSLIFAVLTIKDLPKPSRLGSPNQIV